MRAAAPLLAFALCASPVVADSDMILRTQVGTQTVNGGAGTQITGDCAAGETLISASFVAEQPLRTPPDQFAKARGVYAEGWRTSRTGWAVDVVNYGTRRDLRLTLTLVCYRGEIEEVRNAQ